MLDNAANGQTIIDFLAINGGSGELVNVRWTGGYVWAVVPVSALVLLVKLPEVEQIGTGIPDESGLISPMPVFQSMGD